MREWKIQRPSTLWIEATVKADSLWEALELWEKQFADGQTEEKDFISYQDDDNKTKNQYIIVVAENENGISFKFNSIDKQIIFIPWHRINKLKRREDGIAY